MIIPSARNLWPVVVGVALLASPAKADVRMWSLCTPGALRSCHAVQLTTVPVYAGLIRVGTAVTVTLRNLQGSGLSGTSSLISGLNQVIFTAPVTVAIPANVRFPNATMTGAGASGALSWLGIATNAVTVGGTFAWLEVRATPSSAPDLLGGCGTGPMPSGAAITANTCGTTASAVFAFMINANLDASMMNNLFIGAYAATGSAGCYSNPGAVPFAGQPCDMLSDPLVTPEPATIALVGSGLLGMALRRVRRRTRDS